MNSKKCRKIAAIGLALGVSCAFGAVTAAADTVDLVFKVRVKVEGNIAAINEGIEIKCTSLFYDPSYGPSGTAEKTVAVLAPGQVFTPQTADGYIETEITLKDQNIGDENGATSVHGLSNVYWECAASPAGMSGSSGQSGFLLSNGSAKRPAYAGTCSFVRGQFLDDGTPRNVETKCAAN